MSMHGIICINKPKDWTSFDVVNKLKRHYKTKVGHTGTLDPQATGVLVCLVGLTKVLPYMEMSTKRYRASCKLGIKTDTGDIWGNVIQEDQNVKITQQDLIEVLNSFIGTMSQRVPMTSAKKVKGKKLIDYQRQNIEVETQYTNIEIFECNLLEFNESEFSFDVLVSSGTYIRTLCEDIAEKLNTIGTMSSLVRTEAGQFRLGDCVTLDQLDDAELIPITEGLKHFPQVVVSDKNQIIHGKPLESDYQGNQILVIFDDEPLAIYQYQPETKTYRSRRGLWI